MLIIKKNWKYLYVIPQFIVKTAAQSLCEILIWRKGICGTFLRSLKRVFVFGIILAIFKTDNCWRWYEYVTESQLFN